MLQTAEAKNMRMIQLLSYQPPSPSSVAARSWSEVRRGGTGEKWGAIFALAFAVGGNQTCLLFAVVVVVQPLSLFLIWQMLISRAKRKEDMKGLTNCDWQACVVRPSARGNEYVNGIKRGGEAEGDNLIN